MLRCSSAPDLHVVVLATIPIVHTLHTAGGMHHRGWPSAAASSVHASQAVPSGGASSWVAAAAAVHASHLDINNDLAVPISCLSNMFAAAPR